MIKPTPRPKATPAQSKAEVVAPLDTGPTDSIGGPSVPSGAEEMEEPAADSAAEPSDEPLPKTYVILNGPASYGPVKINGKLIRVKRNCLYHVPNTEERADILGKGRFRAATQKDLQRAALPSAGPGGAITREMLPPGALKGGYAQKG